MGIIYGEKIRSTVVDIVCDICGKSTRNKFVMTYEYATLYANWGYWSRKDDTKWEYYFCEKCSDKIFEFIKPQLIPHNS